MTQNEQMPRSMQDIVSAPISNIDNTIMTIMIFITSVDHDA